MSKFIFLNVLLVTVLSFASPLQKLPRPRLGTDNFEHLIENGGVFVDKSLLLRDLLQDDSKVILITRPRRWGKSINMSMLKYFFKEELDTSGRRLELQPHAHLFNDSKIAKENPEIVKQFQGRYPVMSITLKDVRGKTFPDMKRALESQIVRLFSEYRHVPPIANWWKESGERSDLFLRKIHEKVIGDKILLKDSFQILSQWLYEHHGKRVYFLLDEYDTPLNEACEHGYQREAVDLIRDLLSSMLKGNDYLERAVITGILRASKVNLFSGLNNFKEDSVLSKKYSTYYGFTEAEVDWLLEMSGLESTKASVKKWYNGYSIGGITVYNPWSIVSYLGEKELRPYWLESGTTQLIEHAMAAEDIQEDLATLRAGETIKKSFPKDISFFNFSEDHRALWALLLYAGYLTTTGCQLDDTSLIYQCDLKIPNLEIAGAYGRFLEELLVAKKMPKAAQLKDVNKVFEAIAKRNPVQVRKLFEHKKQIPFSNTWNFNFLQLAVLSGDKNTFKAVYDHYNDATSLGMRSQDGTSVADFSAIAKVSYAELEGINKNVTKPGWLETFCWLDPTLVGAGTGFLTLGYLQLFTKPVGRNQHTSWNVFKKFLGGILASGFEWATIAKVGDHVRSSRCENYDRFHTIDVSEPRTLNSWNKFAKYVDQNPRAYISLGSNCRTGEKAVATFRQSPFSLPLPEISSFNFVLCEMPSSDSHTIAKDL